MEDFLCLTHSQYNSCIHPLRRASDNLRRHPVCAIPDLRACDFWNTRTQRGTNMTKNDSMSYISRRTFERRYRRFLNRSLKQGEFTRCLCRDMKGADQTDDCAHQLTDEELALLEKLASEIGGEDGSLILQKILNRQKDCHSQDSDLEEQIVPLVPGKRRL